jgi:hypothetical protein
VVAVAGAALFYVLIIDPTIVALAPFAIGCLLPKGAPRDPLQIKRRNRREWHVETLLCPIQSQALPN